MPPLPSLRPVWQAAPARSSGTIADGWATAAVTLTILIMAFSTRFGIALILVFYALWLPLLLNWRPVLQAVRHNLMPVLFVTLLLLSTLWSAYRSLTLHNSLEYASMFLCSLIIAQRTSLPAFLKGLNLGTTLVLAITLASHQYGVDYFSGTYSLVGLFGSKNTVGLFAEIGCCGSILYFLSKTGFAGKIIYAFIPMGLSLVCLYLSRSASSMSSLVMVLAVCGATRFVIGLPRRIQAPAIVLSTMAGVMIVALGALAGWQKAGFSLFGKDTTLTGRTWLWGEGIKTAMERPFTGQGFAAFWVPGQPQAEAYWYKFGIFNRSGFHFHNLFIQSFVDVGLFGLLLMIGMYLTNTACAFRSLRRMGPNLTGFFALGIAVMFLIRAMVEVDILPPFGVGPLLFYSLIPRLNRQAEEERRSLALSPAGAA